MKRCSWFYGLLSMVLCAMLLLTACGAEAAQQGSSVDSPSSQGVEEFVGDVEPEHDTVIKAENIDLNNMDDVTAAFLAPLNNDCLYYAWEDASGIRAWHLLNICSRNNLLNLPIDNPIKWHDIPEQDVVTALQRHFDFTSDHLRSNFRYDKEKQTYFIDQIEEEEPVFRAISATQDGSRIEIEVGLTVPDAGEIEDKQSTLLAEYAAVNYEPYGQDRLIFPSGILTVEVTEDNTVRFLSYRFNERFQRETEKLALYRKYAEAFKYPVGRESWSDPKQIEPDALVVYYIYLCGTGEVERPYCGLNDPEFGNPFMFGDALEQAVMSHFDVTPEQIRKSKYYDKDRKAYWSGGIGTTVVIDLLNAKQEGKTLTLTLYNYIESSVYNAHWKSKAVLEVDSEGYKYISYTRDEATIT